VDVRSPHGHCAISSWPDSQFIGDGRPINGSGDGISILAWTVCVFRQPCMTDASARRAEMMVACDRMAEHFSFAT